MHEAGDKLTVEPDEKSNNGVSVTGPDKGNNGDAVEKAEAQKPNGNGNEDGEDEETKRFSFYGRRDKMIVSSNSDGSVLVRPEGDNILQVVGDSDSGAVTIVELSPNPSRSWTAAFSGC